MYDQSGNLMKSQTQNLASTNEEILYGYNYNKLVSIHYPQNPEINAYYTYGAPGSQNQTGRVVKQEDVNGVQEFTYGKLGEVISNTHTFIVPYDSIYTFKTSSTYDTWNRIKSIIYPDGETLTYQYNNGGTLKNMYGIKGNTSFHYIDSLKYDKFESRVYCKYGNGSETMYTYDPERRWMTNLEAKSSNGNLMIQNEYQYDMIGNILKLTNNAGANNGIGGTSNQDFGYDKLNRLNTANGSWTNNTNTYTYDLDMTYAADGKIMYKEQIHELNGNAIQNSTYLHDYQYNAAYKPHAPTQVGLTDYYYDLNGNLSISEDNRNQLIRYFSWDEENRLKMVSDKRSLNYYLYDAGGERTLKIIAPYSQMDVNRDIIWQGFMSDRQTLYVNPFMVVNEKGYTKHYYADNQRIVSKIGGGFLYNPVNVFSQVYGLNCLSTNDYAQKRENDEDMIQRDIDAQWPGCSLHFSRRLLTVIDNEVNRNVTENLIYYYHPDHLGSSNTLTDITGLPFQHMEYMPFGETFVEENIGSYSTPYRFTSKELDDETGLYYYGARYYDPKLSMFLGVDPKLDNYPSWAPYNYCLLNPIKNIDPKGENPFTIIGALVGGATEIVSQTISNGLVNMSNGKNFFNNWSSEIDWADVAISAGEGALAGSTLGISLIVTQSGGGLLRSAVDWKGDNPTIVFGSGKYKKTLNNALLDLAGEATTIGLGHISGLSDIKFQSGIKVNYGNAIYETGLKSAFYGISGFGVNKIKNRIRRATVSFPPMLPGRILNDK